MAKGVVDDSCYHFVTAGLKTSNLPLDGFVLSNPQFSS